MISILKHAAGLAIFILTSTPAQAWEILARTHLVNMTHGTRLSEAAQDLARGGYELAGGEYMDFRTFYRQNWREMRFDFMTQLNDNVGVLWAVSTGERGPKYRIAPGFKIGFILQVQPTPMSSLSLSMSKILGSRLRELPCTADYGDVGGVQQVNCRLAASELPPAETLKYSLNMRAPDHGWIGFRYQLRF